MVENDPLLVRVVVPWTWAKSPLAESRLIAPLLWMVLMPAPRARLLLPALLPWMLSVWTPARVPPTVTEWAEKPPLTTTVYAVRSGPIFPQPLPR